MGAALSRLKNKQYDLKVGGNLEVKGTAEVSMIFSLEQVNQQIEMMQQQITFIQQELKEWEKIKEKLEEAKTETNELKNEVLKEEKK